MRARTIDNPISHLEHLTLNPLGKFSNNYKAFVLFLLAIVGLGLYAYIIQVKYGLVVTGMRDQVMWGLYILDFIFFLGIAMAGTVISAILRLTHASWRTPITRMAELITVAALMIGALMPLVDLGRPDRIWEIFVYGRFQSAIVWDIVVISTYLVGSLIYLYLSLIPDLALMRDRVTPQDPPLKKKVLTFLAVGWTNTQEQRHRLDRAIAGMAIAIIPMAVFTHTVASFIFSWMLRPGWNSTIYGIYFVVGAVFSGIATILIVMFVVRKVGHLEEYLNEKHFRYLSYLLLALLFTYLYLVTTEFLTIGYKMQLPEKDLLTLLFVGQDAPFFWFFIIAGFVFPAIMLAGRFGKPIPRIIAGAISINLAMWISRFLIVVPSLQVPSMPGVGIGLYTPSWVEWAITAGAFAGFALIFTLVSKFLPIISIWEVAEESEVKSGIKTLSHPEKEVAGA